MSTAPIVSILTPVYRPDMGHFKACVDSVVDQTSTEWELILIDDASEDADLSDFLKQCAGHPQIVVVQRAENGGIVAASNDALRAADGKLVAFLDHDDMLAPTAIEQVVLASQANPTAEVLYSDRGHIDEEGKRVGRDFLKPRWSPERLRANMYIAHLTALNREAALDVGGFHAEFEGSQDHDLVLRVTERGRPVVHIPEVLYLWRMSARSTAADPDTKPYARTNGAFAVQEHCKRTGIDATVVQGAAAGWYELERRPARGLTASIIIPTYGSHATIRGKDLCMVVEAVRSVAKHAYAVSYEFVVVYDDRPGIDLDYLEDLAEIAGDRLKPVRFTEPFNFSRKVNVGAIHASGDVLVLLNDDTEVITPDWLDHLCSLATEPGVGVAGPKLLLENGWVQHGGIGLVHGDVIVNVDNRQANDGGYFGALVSDHEVMAVTGACLAVRSDLYREVGGFSEDFAGSFNDVDFCFKLLNSGYRNIAANTIEMYHYESLTRDPQVKPSEHDNLYGRWYWFMQHDPYLREQSPPR